MFREFLNYFSVLRLVEKESGPDQWHVAAKPVQAMSGYETACVYRRTNRSYRKAVELANAQIPMFNGSSLLGQG